MIGIAAGAVLGLAVALWVTRTRRPAGAPHFLVPDRGEMAGLFEAVKAGAGDDVQGRWIRGAVYWGALAQGRGRDEALDMALDPWTGLVRLKLVPSR